MFTSVELVAEAKNLVGLAQKGGLSADQHARVKELPGLIQEAKEQEAAYASLRDSLDGSEVKSRQGGKPGKDASARTLGAHFKAWHDDQGFSGKGHGLADAMHNRNVVLPEFDAKAAADVTTGRDAAGEQLSPAQQIAGVETLAHQPLTVAALFSQGVLTQNTLEYLVQEPTEGTAKAVGAGKEKPHLHFKFRKERDGLVKIAGLATVEDEMLEDVAFLVSVIEGELVTELLLEEERQLLAGDGTGDNMRGLLNRNGVLVHQTTGSLGQGVLEAVNRILMGSSRQADAVVIHPLDYEKERLSQDGNGQYLAGGPFYGQYGVGGVALTPPLWGLRTVVTPAVTQGTPLVGAFSSATLFRKGGVKLDASNSHDANFARNLTTLRAEERVGLMVPRPAAFAKVSVKVSP